MLCPNCGQELADYDWYYSHIDPPIKVGIWTCKNEKCTLNEQPMGVDAITGEVLEPERLSIVLKSEDWEAIRGLKKPRLPRDK